MTRPGANSPRPPRPGKTAVSWVARVEDAASEHEVVEVARDFLAQFTPYEVHALPDDCKPPAKIVDADDVNAYALSLVRHDCAEAALDAAPAHKMADFFSRAAGRLARLANDAGPVTPS